MRRYLPFLVSILLTACSGNLYAPSNRIYKKQARQAAKTISRLPLPVMEAPGVTETPDFVGTTNFNLRKPDFVIIHHTAQNSTEQTLKTFTLSRTQVSAHYVIGRDGIIYHMLNDYLRAWHAGVGKWGKDNDINSSSIGIELDNNGFEPFSEVQINSLLALLDHLKKTYHIPTANFIGHADIAPQRKQDPSKYFPWKTLAEQGYGFWYDELLELPPPGYDYITALRLIGYDVTDSTAAIRAFKLHFIQTDTEPVLTQLDKNVIYNLIKKY